MWYGTIPKHNDREITKEKGINERDKCYKEKIKHKAENRNTRKHDFKIGDYVLLEQNKRDKWSTVYEPAFYNIFVINGSTVGARRVSDGRVSSKSIVKCLSIIIYSLILHAASRLLVFWSS
jgi:hypothetical protein